MICDLFESQEISKWVKCTKEGHVTACKDHKIKSSVHRISGDTPSSNFILLPQTSSHSLNLTHKYLYILFKPTPGRYFVINFTCSTPTGLLVKLSLSNLFKQLQCGKACLQIPYVFDSDGNGSVPVDRGVVVQTTPTPAKSKWSVIAFNLPQLFSSYCINKYGYLRSIQLCANMTVKGAYTSDQLLTPNTLLQCMALPLTNGLNYSDVYDYVIVPPLCEYKATPITTPSALLRHVSVQQGHSSGVLEPKNEIMEVQDYSLGQDQSTELVVKTTTRWRKETADNQVGPPPMMLQMTHMIGIGPCYKGFINKFGNRVFYCCNSVIVAMDTYLKQQQFFIGHSNKVSSIAIHEESLLLASTDITGLLMLWDISSGESCQVIKTATQSPSSCVSFSPDGNMLCCMWSESMTRSSLVLYSVPDMVKIASHTHLTIHSTVMKFISANTIATCGRGHIRICRIKNNCIRSSPVVIDDYHNHMFTDIATLHNSQNIYVSCTVGLVFEVDIHQLALIRVWSLNPGAGEDPIIINSLSCDDQYCVTGCGDGVVRVWPLDFSMVVMETEFNDPAMYVGVASGVVMCTTQTSLGLLDTNEQGYTTLVRAMCSVVTDMAINSDEDQLITCTEDGLLQIWNLLITKNNKHMVYQFNSINDTPTSVCFVGRHNSLILCGYTSGIVRIISLCGNGDQINTVEHRLDDGAIVGVASLHNGDRAYAATLAGSLVMIDSSDSINGYPIMKTISNSVSMEGRKGCGLVISSDDTKLACISSSNQIIVYNTMTLNEVSSIDVSTILMPRPSAAKCSISQLCYDSNNLYVLASNGQILKYNGATCSTCPVTVDTDTVPVVMEAGNGLMVVGNNDGSLIIVNEGIEEVFIGHRSSVNKVLITGSHIVSCADNEMIIWAWHPPVKAPPPPIPNSPPQPRLQVSLSTSRVSARSPSPLSSESHDSNSHDQTSRNPLSHDRKSRDIISCDPVNDEMCKPHELFVPPIGSEVIQLQYIIGHTTGRAGCGTSVQWCPTKDLVCYVCGCVVIVEDLHNTIQYLLTGHHTVVTDIRLQTDGCGLASASCSHGNWDAEIKIWEGIDDKWTCEKTICDSSIKGYSCLSFSPDNRYLLAIGVTSSSPTIFQSCNLLLWSCNDYALLSMTIIDNQLINMIAWDHNTAYEFATVGVAGIQFWLMAEDQYNRSVDLKTHIPENHQLSESCAISYNRNYMLFVGSNKGVVSVWSTVDNSYITKWKTGIGKIVDLCSNHGNLIVGGISCIQLWNMQQSTDINGSVGISNILNKCTITLPDNASLVSMVFDHPILNTGVVSTTDHTLYVIDWNEADLVKLLDCHHGNVTSVDVSDTCIVTGDDMGIVRAWSMIDHAPQLALECVLDFGNKNKECVGVLAPPTKTTPTEIVCGYSDSQVMLMKYSKGAEHHRSFVMERIKMTKITMKDELLVSGYIDGRVLINEVATGNHLSTLTDHRESAITDLSISKEKISVPGVSIHSFHLLIISSSNGRVSIWKLSRTPSMIDWISFPKSRTSHKTKSHNTVALPTLARFMYPDNIVYVTGTTQQPSLLQYYSLTQKQIVKEVKLKNSVLSMCLSHDYQLIAFGSYDQILTIMDTDEGTFQEYHAHHQSISNLIFNPLDTQLVSTSSNCFAIWKVLNNL